MTELRDGGIAVTTMQGHLFVIEKDGRKRWRFKVPETIYAEEVMELRNGNLAVGSSAGFLYFLTREGALLGRYHTDNCAYAAPTEMADGAIVAGISVERGTSHNLYVFSPTGQPFIQAASLSGRHCRSSAKRAACGRCRTRRTPIPRLPRRTDHSTRRQRKLPARLPGLPPRPLPSIIHAAPTGRTPTGGA